MAGHRAFIYSDLENFKYCIEYYHYPKRWMDNLLPIGDDISNSAKWSQEMKFLNDTNDDLSDDIKKLPTSHGGIYMFYIKGLNLPFAENYILYIGRCQYTSSQHIKKRAREYLNSSRIMIKSMFDRWKPYLYYRYFPETDNDRIKQLEVTLIRSIVPPLNEDIPNRLFISPSVHAFIK